jgi:two-component system, NtrC family, sensor kinase
MGDDGSVRGRGSREAPSAKNAKLRIRRQSLDFRHAAEKRVPRLFEPEEPESRLVSRLFARRKELEDQVTLRARELELRNDLLHAITSSEDDTAAYSAVVDAIGRSFSADAAILAYCDGAGRPKAVLAAGGAAKPVDMDAQSIASLKRASAGATAALEVLGLERGYSLAFSLDLQDEQCGYVAIARRERPFMEEEKSLFTKALEAFANQMLMRERKTRQELIRREAEKALRRSEERIRTFFEESKDMIYSSNAEDVVAQINAAGLELLGVEDRFEVLGRPFSDYVESPEDRRSFLARLREQGFATDYECVFKRKDGSTLFCIETARAVKDKDGRILEIQGIVKDVSERISHERELWKANMELAEANEQLKSTQMLMVQHEKLASIGQLAAGIAHEINNPLGFLKSNQATLRSFIATIREAWDEATASDPAAQGEIARRLDLAYVFDETTALLQESDEGFRRIIDIVKNLKSFARIEVESVLGPYDLNKGVEDSLVVARNEIRYCAEAELGLGELMPIRAAGGEINQVILNLLVNAAQAIESQKREEKGRILVSTRLEGDWAILEIADDGPGVPEENRLRIFDPFYTTKEPGKGTGLGLSISYDVVVRKHGGSIGVFDSPLGGALFRIELPISGPPETNRTQ